MANAGLVAVAMGGKVVRNTIAPGGGEGSEITQVTALLAEFELTGVVVTGDAGHAQQATGAHIATERGDAYVSTVKRNRPGLLAGIAAVLPPAAPGTELPVAVDRDRGRIVRRATWAVSADGIDFPGAAQVFRIRRDTFDHLGHGWVRRSCMA